MNDFVAAWLALTTGGVMVSPFIILFFHANPGMKQWRWMRWVLAINFILYVAAVITVLLLRNS